LQVKDNPAWHNCWGPGLVDRLDLKGPKTFLQQLPLSSTSLGWESIPLAWRSWPLVKRVFAKGTIFYRWDPEREAFADRLKTLELPTGLNPEHQKSWWIMPESLAALRERYSRSKIAIVPRRFWMTGLIPFAGAESLENWNTFIANFALRAKLASEKKECLFVGIYDPTGKAQVQCFGFIATPHFFERFNQQ